MVRPRHFRRSLQVPALNPHQEGLSLHHRCPCSRYRDCSSFQLNPSCLRRPISLLSFALECPFRHCCHQLLPAFSRACLKVSSCPSFSLTDSPARFETFSFSPALGQPTGEETTRGQPSLGEPTGEELTGGRPSLGTAQGELLEESPA